MIDLFRRIIVENELGGNKSLAYKFSDPDGERTGKSGWSFGVCQFDLANNPVARKILRDCEFTDSEIGNLQLQTNLPMWQLNAQLLAHKTIVDEEKIQKIL